jgi:non-specific serine/threonine protein kinase/serine/threonine-protein kinase
MGTLTYMSPEQAEMTGLDVDTRSDIYALGVMLYALAIGKPPLDPKVLGVPAFLTQLLQPDVAIPTALSRLKAMDPADASFAARCRNTDVQRLAREVGGDLQWILLKALEKDRNRRYESVSGLSTDLSRYLTDEPISARRPTASYRFGKFVRRNRVAVMAAAAAALGLIGGTAAATIGMLKANASEERARHEAATAEEVSGFLVGLFRVSDPLEARGNTVTAREILDAGSARIRTELNDQPAVQARLMATMASVYDGLGLFDVAAELIEEVIRAQRTADAPDLEIATSLFRLASIRAQQGRLREAEQHQRAALAARVSATGPTDLEVARSQHDLARILARLGRGDTAVVLLRAALDTRRALLGPEHADLVVGHADLSEVLLMAGRPAEAVEAAESAVTLATRLYGQDDRIGEVADAYSRLAAALYGARDLIAAERAEREALRRRTGLFDDGHPNVLIVELNLGIILYEQGRFDESEALIREVSQAVLDRLPPNHAYVETAQVYLALNLASLDRHGEASAVAEQAFGLISGNPDQNLPRVMGTIRVSDLALYASLAAGKSLVGLGRVDEARAYLERTRDGLDGRQGAPGEAAAAARSALLSLDATARPAASVGRPILTHRNRAG